MLNAEFYIDHFLRLRLPTELLFFWEFSPGLKCFFGDEKQSLSSLPTSIHWFFVVVFNLKSAHFPQGWRLPSRHGTVCGFSCNFKCRTHITPSWVLSVHCWSVSNHTGNTGTSQCKLRPSAYDIFLAYYRPALGVLSICFQWNAPLSTSDP